MAICLAWIAGFVDACGFIALFGLFTAHVTGNFVLIGAALAAGGGGVLGKLLALPTFIVAVALTRWIVILFEARRRTPQRFLLLLQAALLAAFMICGILVAAGQGADSAASILTGMVGVAAMGVQNGASRLIFAKLSPTTVMTGNVTQAVIDAVDLLRASPPPESGPRFKRMLPPVLSFAVGAVAAAFGYLWFGYLCLIAPIALLAWLATRSVEV